jgi:hypothetical protein
MKRGAAILTVAAVVLALAAGRDALIAWSLAINAAEVQRHVAGDPAVALALADRLLPPDKPPTPAQADALVRDTAAVLRSRPLHATALRDLARARAPLDVSRAEMLLLLAQRVSRRDPSTQNLLLRLAAERGDYGAAMAHLDRILTVNPKAIAIFRDTMVMLLDDPEAVHNLARFGNRPWFTDFALYAAGRVASPENLADLLMHSGMADEDHRGAIAPPVLRRLIAAGRYEQAREFAMRFVRASRSQLDGFGISAATTARALAPLSWRLGDGDKAQASLIGASTIAIDAYPGVPAVALERITLLPPGSYVLEQQVGQNDAEQPVSLEWRLACGDAAAPILRQPVPVAAYRLRVEIPRDCPAQRWQLRVQVGDVPTGARLEVARLRLTAR